MFYGEVLTSPYFYFPFLINKLSGLKARRTEDILITATDNLNRFLETIRIVFPESKIQTCIVHQIRNVCRYVVWKDNNKFTSDMKNIYNASNKEIASVTQ